MSLRLAFLAAAAMVFAVAFAQGPSLESRMLREDRRREEREALAEAQRQAPASADELRFFDMAACAYASSGEQPVAAALKAKLLLEERRKVTGAAR